MAPWYPALSRHQHRCGAETAMRTTRPPRRSGRVGVARLRREHGRLGTLLLLEARRIDGPVAVLSHPNRAVQRTALHELVPGQEPHRPAVAPGAAAGAAGDRHRVAR